MRCVNQCYVSKLVNNCKLIISIHSQLQIKLINSQLEALNSNYMFFYDISSLFVNGSRSEQKVGVAIASLSIGIWVRRFNLFTIIQCGTVW